jgi:hypothetical protein
MVQGVLMDPQAPQGQQGPLVQAVSLEHSDALEHQALLRFPAKTRGGSIWLRHVAQPDRYKWS